MHSFSIPRRFDEMTAADVLDGGDSWHVPIQSAYYMGGELVCDSVHALTDMGFDVHERAKIVGKNGQQLFYRATPPPGWTKHTEGGHTEIRDKRGKVRARQFYKAEFYDRRAHISFTDEKYSNGRERHEHNL